MLLSRVAASVYWAGRYLERAEATARLIRVHTDLILDLPRAAGVGFEPLLAIIGHEPVPGEKVAEDDVIRLLAADPGNLSSIVSTLEQAR